jgi:DNA polymerase Ligase (LigD)
MTMTQPVSGDGLREYLERHARGETDVNEPPMFVLQQHQAGDMHFNQGFEVAADSLSGRRPDAPWPNPEAKRAAVQIEDYPLDRATFEGANPPGQYGGGVLLLRDAGGYRYAR